MQGTSRGLYTKDLKDLMSTSYFGDTCRHIYSGYQMLLVKHTTGRYWQNLENPIFMSHNLLKSYCRVLLNLLKVTTSAYVVFYQH